MKTLSYVNATGSVNLASEVYTYNLNLNRDVSSVFGPCRACGWSFWKRPRTVQTPPRPPRRGLSYTLNQVRRSRRPVRGRAQECGGEAARDAECVVVLVAARASERESPEIDESQLLTFKVRNSPLRSQCPLTRTRPRRMYSCMVPQRNNRTWRRVDALIVDVASWQLVRSGWPRGRCPPPPC